MIKVGDYIKHKDNGMIYKVIISSEKVLYITDFKQSRKYIGVDVATNNYIVVDYKQLYEQQKHRADRAEKRWSELREYLNDGENLCLVELTRDEVIRKMHDLEEDGE